VKARLFNDGFADEADVCLKQTNARSGFADYLIKNLSGWTKFRTESRGKQQPRALVRQQE